MSKLWSCNEWDPLEEVVVGNPLDAHFPFADPSTQLAEYPDRQLNDIPQGPFPQQIIDETEEDLQIFIDAMTALGIKILKVGMPFPFDIDTYKEFARGLDTILIVEEKRDLLATGFREACYDIATEDRPKLVGRLDCQGGPYCPMTNPLRPTTLQVPWRVSLI